MFNPTKDDIRTFLDRKYQSCLVTHVDEMARIEKEAAVFIFHFFDEEALRTKLNELDALLQVFRVKFHTLVPEASENHYLDREIRNITLSLPSIFDYLKRNFVPQYLTGQAFPTDHLTALANAYKKEISEKKKLNTLRKEIENVIVSSRKGKDAYKQLVALGVDFTGFDVQAVVLPDIIRFSVDVGLINVPVADKAVGS